MADGCSHTHQVRDVDTEGDAWEECARTGDRWVHLRVCLTCGHVGCCDASPGRHARAHFRATGHPIIQSAEPGETWRWCYADEMYVIS